jgi:anthranilate phosphoribosyltransferase
LKLLPKKKAGYLSGYADPEYIEQLQQISTVLGVYRGFPVEGDSMPPHQDGDIIVGTLCRAWAKC